MQEQRRFIDTITNSLKTKSIAPRTLGVTDYDTDSPLAAIRRLMLESDGFITVALRRTYIQNGTKKMNADLEEVQTQKIKGQWFTSPYCQIEAAMAYQLGLPILTLREEGVIAEGILEKGVVGSYLPEFNLSNISKDYMETDEWKQAMSKWEADVRIVNKKKGYPNQLY
ncbi:hypothetical protein CD191_01040 [Paenibacillus odorifer]|uniref:Uncharacterized protein n=2 Tax=Paenibacillus odorifer TaxID=189426 RepID=A0AAD0KNR0_9BACL|nr:hypothetical protein CD191_01040 [Paenibacillus odorifer]